MLRHGDLRPGLMLLGHVQTLMAGVFLCSAVIDNRLEDKHPLNFPDASSEDRKAAVSRKVARSSSSEYTGVTWHKRDSIWNAAITIRYKEGRGEIIRLGTYKDECDAALAWDRHIPANHPLLSSSSVPRAVIPGSAWSL